MAKDNANVFIPTGGRTYIAPVGTDPVAIGATLTSTAWVELGHTTPDGQTLTIDQTSESIYMYGGLLVGEVLTESSMVLGLGLGEQKKETIELTWATVVNTTEGSYVINSSATGGKVAIMHDVFQEAGGSVVRTQRWYAPEAQRTTVDEVGFEVGSAQSLNVDMSLLYNEELGGNVKVFDSKLIVAAPTP